MDILTLAKWEERLRPLFVRMPVSMVIARYSVGRLDFLEKLKKELPTQVSDVPEDRARTLWGIRFRSPIMNAAGMFKNGECYEMVAMQGAGAYLGGTGTWNERRGNEKESVRLPFVPYRGSHAASNFLGLPNDGDMVNSQRARQMGRMLACPIGWSVMGSPDFSGEEKLDKLVRSMKLYEHAGVDFLEMNESCPNTGERKLQDSGLIERLTYVKTHFLDERVLDCGRKRVVPVMVKFSNDTNVEDVPMLLDSLFSLGYDGVNFGNTSTLYEKRREMISFEDKKLYSYFTTTFGGGVSGRPLRESSLELCARAVEYIQQGGLTQEFHVIRTGGVESWKDVEESARVGVQLNQWYTGYFTNFAEVGHRVYERMWER